VQEIKPEASVDRSIEEKFVFSGKPKPREETSPRPPAQSTETAQSKPPANKPLGRVPLTTRVRADFATALKRASLERQLSGVSPNTLQDILEQALEPWLRSHGYLT
jgi:hypothetical protein